MRTRSSPQQLLAVSFALMMLVSVGGLAFVGGAGAQTGGTFDTAVENEVGINSEVNISEERGDVSIIGPDDSFDGDDLQNITVNEDGSVSISSDSNVESDEFGGVAVSAERVDTLFSADADPGTEPATFLDEVVATYSVSGQNASYAGNNESYPVILIEYDPQSDFSQIEGGDGNVTGEHDYLAVVADGESNVTAYSIDNNNANATTTPVSNADSFGAVFDGLVGSGTADLQNENIDSVTFAAGVGLGDDTGFDKSGFGGATISDLRLSDGTTERLINNEKIALNPNGDTEFYSSVTDAVANASAGDTIDVAAGLYDTFEDNTITVGTEVTITGANSASVNDRVDLTSTDSPALDDDSTETELNANISVTADDTTLENVAVTPAGYDSGDHISVNADGTTINNTVVLQSGTQTGINVTTTAGTSTTIHNVAVVASNTTSVNDGDTGLNLSTQSGETVTVTDSLFVGHQTQIDGNENVNETAFLGQFDAADAQSAVAVNAADVVQGNAIFGNITDADAAATDSEDNITVSAGTYAHGGEVPINTADVTITDTSGTAATISEGVNITATGSVTVNGFSINGDLTATTGSPEALTVHDTNVAESGSGVITIDDVDTVSLNGTNATDHQLGETTALGTVTLTDTYEYTTTDTSFDINATGDVSVTNASYGEPVPGPNTPGLTIDTGGDVDVVDSDVGTTEIGLTTTPSAVNITDGEATNYVINATGNVDVDGVTATPSAGTDGINITSGAPQNISVTNATVTLSGADRGVNVTAPGNGDETVVIKNVTVNGNSTDGTGVALTDIDTGLPPAATYEVDENTLSNFGNGTGLIVNEVAGASGDQGSISISENDIEGGSTFVGMEINLSAAENVNMSSNDIIGADVAGGADSVGIEFLEAPTFSSGFLAADSGGASFENNVISGHARLIEDSSSDEPALRESGYNRILNESELGNEMGTVVVGPDRDFGATYGVNGDAHGQLHEVDGTVYLPGSLNESMKLIEKNPEISSSELVVYEPSVDSAFETPTTYDDDPVRFAVADSIDVRGENDGVTVNTTFTVPNEGTTLANHNLTDLTINSDGTAITVDKNNTQSTFRNLDVTVTDGSDGDGLIVNADSEDVNVIEVADSSFDVDADGIVLSGGADGARNADDRDGFIVDNVTITGSGIGDGHTGLNLSEVTKPGTDTLSVGLSVTDNTINDFETQVDVGENITGVNATALTGDTTPAVADVEISGNEFSHAVLVFNGSNLSADNLYGSVNAADDAASDGDRIEVRDVQTSATTYDHDGDTDNGNVEIGTANVTVTTEAPSSTLSSSVSADDIVLADPLNTTADNVTVDGFVVVAPAGNSVLTTDEYGATTAINQTNLTVVGAGTGHNLTVQNATITTTLTPKGDAAGAMPVGIGAPNTTSSNTSLTISDTYVGTVDYDSATTTGSAVVAQENVSLSITDSEFRAGENGVDTSSDPDTLVSEAHGILAANGTSPTIQNTIIAEFDADGINTEAEQLNITGGEIADNNADTRDSGTGGVITNASVSGNFTIDNVDVVRNMGDGVNVDVGSLDLTDANVSANDGDGTVVSADTAVDVHESTVSNNDGTGLNASNTADVTVETSDIESNAATVDTAGNATVSESTFSADGSTALNLSASNATVTDNTIENSDTGLDLNTTATDDPVVTLNTITGNSVGFAVTNGTNATVTGNHFASTGQDIDSQTSLDASLNYFDTHRGPTGSSAAGVSSNVVYDPFLTEAPADIPAAESGDVTVAEVESTTSFGHDVVIPADETVSVGIPAQLEIDRKTRADVFDTEAQGSLYKFNATSDTFEHIDGSDLNDNVEAFDGYVIDNTGNDSVATIEYQSSRSAFDTPANAFEFEEGLNFVPPTQAGTVNDALFPGGDTDFVGQPFVTGENLYGDTGASQVRDEFVDPSNDGFGENFRGDAGTQTVHPHAAYLVIVNENSNDGLTVVEQIPAPDAPTADNIQNRTDEDSDE